MTSSFSFYIRREKYMLPYENINFKGGYIYEKNIFKDQGNLLQTCGMVLQTES